MRRFEIHIDYPMQCDDPDMTTIRFEMPDDATDEQIEAEARESFGDKVSYGFVEITEPEK